MDIDTWRKHLESLPLGEIYLYQEVGSTNQVAEGLMNQGAPHLSLVLADSQTAGKGREGRSWTTNPRKALAFSLILYPDPGLIESAQLEKLSSLGALAVAEALTDHLGLNPEIKWPNDVLVDRKKVSGVLVDLNWNGSELKGVVIGIGINVFRGSVPEYELNYPASSLEELGGEGISRLDLLLSVLGSFLRWYPRLGTQTFLTAWEAYLAFKGERVSLVSSGRIVDQGLLVGISPDGALIIHSDTGEERHYRTGEIQLRLVDRSGK
jgi:BirA family biotin operon repressor/biotin-[acetyl-CoA-carboxylase] ligase